MVNNKQAMVRTDREHSQIINKKGSRQRTLTNKQTGRDQDSSKGT